MKNLLYLLCFMLSVQTMSAQGWYRYYDNLPQGELFSGLQVPNGDYVVAGAETVNGSLFLAKMDVDGRVIELRNNYNILINDISQLKRSPEGNLVLLGATRSSFQDISVLVFDGDLNLSAEIVLPSLGFIEKPSVFVFDEEGNIIISAFVQKDMRVQPILAKLDMDGNILWHIPTNEQMGHISDMELNAQGDITLVGKALNDDKAFVSVFDALTGAELAYKLIGNNPLEEEEALDIMSKNDDGAYLLTRFNVLDAATGNIVSSHLRMRNLDSNLEVINSYDLSRDIRLEEFVGMHLLDDGTFSYCFLSSEEYERFYIQVVHLDADMQTELWSRSYPDISPEIEYARDFVLTNDGGYLLPGSIANGSSMPLLLRLDAAGTAFTNVISGNVYHDKIKNCQIDPVESVLPSWLVEIQGAGETYYRMSDADGSYSIAVDEGTFDVRVIPQSDAWLPCPPTAVQFNGFYQSTSVDAGVQSLFDCPVMTADISIGSLRRCYERYYDVEYCNIGTEAATGVYIEVEIDSQLLVGNTSIPIDSQNGNLLSFNIGNLGVNQCGTFQVGVNTPCSVPLGDIHCSTVHIYPDTICMDATDWSGAKIKVVGECGDNNQVNFEIRNIGSANMDQPRSFTVIEDEVVLMTGTFELNAGEVMPVNVWANGGVYRLEAEQVINYPTNSQPSVVVPGCGTFYDPEYMTWYPMDDSELFYDISCKENVDSYDPNDKQAEPVGYSNEHYIEANTDLEYQLRFQNTGTDTAYHVVIVDTLPEHLDVSTFRLGVSSHPCEVTVSSKNGLNILRFNFEFANLLPLTVDETQSSGYIKFNISQLRDLAEGTQIYNDASIYFDFNDPIVTNKTKHTIASNFIIEDLIIGGHTGEETPILNVVVGPNPIIDHAIFEVLDMDFDATAEFLLYSADGKLIRIANLTGNTYVLERNGLAHGMYLYSIILSTGDKYHGKIIFR